MAQHGQHDKDQHAQQGPCSQAHGRCRIHGAPVDVFVHEGVQGMGHLPGAGPNAPVCTRARLHESREVLKGHLCVGGVPRRHRSGRPCWSASLHPCCCFSSPANRSAHVLQEVTRKKKAQYHGYCPISSLLLTLCSFPFWKQKP